MTRRFEFPSGAGTDGLVLGNLFFLVAVVAMGWWTSEPAMNQALRDRVQRPALQAHGATSISTWRS